MGILNTILGNVSEMDADVLKKEFGVLLCEDEIFTNKRLIILDVQGVTGKKREYLSIPYRSVNHFLIETAGTLDTDAEMKIWIKGCDVPLTQNFGRNSNLAEIQRVLADYVL